MIWSPARAISAWPSRNARTPETLNDLAVGDVRPSTYMAASATGWGCSQPGSMSSSTNGSQGGLRKHRQHLLRNGIQQGEELARRARSKLWQFLVDTHKDQAKTLVDALRGSPFWTLHSLVWGEARRAAKQCNGVPFARWDELAATIVSAANMDRAVMLPQLVLLAAREVGKQHDERQFGTLYEFDEAQATALFWRPRHHPRPLQRINCSRIERTTSG